jgi:hypothetical protein
MKRAAKKRRAVNRRLTISYASSWPPTEAKIDVAILLRQWHIEMATWRVEDVSFRLSEDESDHPVVTMVIDTPVGNVFVMAEPIQVGQAMTLQGLHVHGETTAANDIGAANLRLVIAAFMEEYDLETLVVAGGLRSNGEGSGRTPRALRFTRGFATASGRRKPRH